LTTWKHLQTQHDVHFADREVKVVPLTVEECTELTISLVGKDSEVIRQREWIDSLGDAEEESWRYTGD